MRINKTVKIKQYDTLRFIAARELNDQTRWSELIALNNLKHPYITPSFDSSDRINGTLLWGELIYLPILVEADTTWTTADTDTKYTNLFGTDIKLTDGKITCTNGAINILSGVNNLKQALTNRVACERGDYLVHLEYGSNLYTLLGLKNRMSQALIGSAYTKQAIESDARVLNNVKISAEILQDKLKLKCRVTPKSSNDSIDFNLTLPIV